MIEDVGGLIAVGYVGQVVTFVLSIGLRHILPPAEVGVVAFLGLAATYAPYLALGCLQAGERLIALEIGRQDGHAARQVESATVIIALAASIALVIGAATYVLIRGASTVSSALVGATVFMVMVQQLTALAIIKLRTSLRFRAVAGASFLAAVLASGGGVVGALAGGLPGAVVGTVLGYAIAAMVVARAVGIHLEAGIGASVGIRRVIAEAPRFFALGATTVLLYTIDQLIVSIALGAAAFGLYSTAYLGNAFLVRIPANISAAIFPRLQISAGRGTELENLTRSVGRASALSGVVAAPLVALSIIAFPVAVTVLLPAYAAAIPAMRLVLLAVLGLVLAGPPSQLLIARGRAWLVVVATTAASILIMLGSFLADRIGVLSIASVAFLDCCAYLAFGVVLQTLVEARSPRAVLARVIPTYLPALAVISAAVLVGPATGGRTTVTQAAGQVIAFLVSWPAALWATLRVTPELQADLRTAASVASRFGHLVRRGRPPVP